MASVPARATSVVTSDAPDAGFTAFAERGAGERREASVSSLVGVAHDAVPGRARLNVVGLKGSPRTARLLERGMRAAPGVRAARASDVTGNLLVQFDRAMPLSILVERIEGLLTGKIAPPDEEEAGGEAWHRLEPAKVAEILGASPTEGLDPRAARERLAKSGRNLLPKPLGRSPGAIFLGQFQSLPVALLAVASAVSIATGGAAEALAIMGVVALNGVIGYVTESRAERTIQGLGAVERPDVCVVRGGRTVEAPVETLVPGDLLVLKPGMIVPADARLVSARALTVSEAALTGESIPVRKHAGALEAASAPLADRRNMVHRGTLVTGGSGTAIVVATGLATQVGRIQRLVGTSAPPQTPMQRQLDGLGRQIVWLSLGVSGAVFGLGWLRGLAFLQLVRSSLSLAVAAVPEGLPTVATTTLAIGIDQMRRQGVLVRRLDAIETLASANVICFDKTGTLTRNEMRVAAIACGERALRLAEPPSGAETDALTQRLLEIGALCSEVELDANGGEPLLSGSSTERALVQTALERGVDVAALRARLPRVSLQHRTEAYRFMASIHDDQNGALIAVKGSPLEVLDRCGWEALPGGGRRPLTPARREAIIRINAEMARQALRVLGFAERSVEAGAWEADSAAQDLTWIGLAGMADPPRAGVAEVIARLQRAGLRTVMMTGDQSATARAIAEQLGLGAGVEPQIVDAADLDGLSPSELTAAVRRAHVFARVSPEQKLRVLRALQASGQVVAMVGDGINDSPALRAADVGVALGQGGATAAREVADVVLESDDLAALLVALERGRTTYTNVRKSIRYLLSTNGSEILVMLAATAAGVAEPLSPMQLLWINLVSDILPGLGLALEPPEPQAMDRGPSPADTAIVGPADRRALAAEAAVLSSGALAACAYGALRYGASSPRTRTMTFASLVAAQLLHAFSCRSTHSVLGPRRLSPNPALGAAIGLSAAIQAAAFAVPGVRRLLGVSPLGPADLAVTAAAGVAPFLALERAKARRGRWTLRATAAHRPIASGGG